MGTMTVLSNFVSTHLVDFEIFHRISEYFSLADKTNEALSPADSFSGNHENLTEIHQIVDDLLLN